MPQAISSESHEDYSDRYVVFLDLLGFKAEVERAEQNPAERQRLHDILKLVRDTLCENHLLSRTDSQWSLGDFCIRQFSDV